MSRWVTEIDQGPVAGLHLRARQRLGDLEPGRRLAVVHQPTGPALALGSTQPETAADRQACQRAGVQVARRYSGGGAVLVDPAAVVWVDLLLPLGDPLWSADVGRAMWWVGEVWARALGGAGVTGAMVWRGALQRRAWSSLVCFAGLGPGEVTVDGRKVVGVSQRRSRQGALFQTACLLEWEPERLVSLLALDGDERARCRDAISEQAAGAGRARAAPLLEVFLANLP